MEFPFAERGPQSVSLGERSKRELRKRYRVDPKQAYSEPLQCCAFDGSVASGPVGLSISSETLKLKSQD